MGRNKTQNKCSLIEDEANRGVTFSKRKRGLIKKAIELSTLCGHDISLSIYDRAK